MLIKHIDARARKEAANLAGPLMVSRGKVYQLEELPGCCVEDTEGNLLGAIFYTVLNGECEIVSLESRAENQGAGTRLIEAVITRARAEGCARVWLITSNDNTKAIRFYQKRGFDFKAVHRGAITEARKLKPSIPLIGYDGIPVRHELELEYLL
ncbi:GNAT family N-acetyltransferase [Paenibacillus zanthoxyli]|uniref:GNAT family N-acetyltransferase n=1 Tax=Paenibacillus zanthoxyli TaxID=369399 RepID=UPI0004B77DE3|nr:GNAT family N-acetyltransferase [Paenibacillus zanthoxyli]